MPFSILPASSTHLIEVSPCWGYTVSDMIETKEELIQLIQPIILEETAIDLCVLYGSAARDKLTSESDIDLAVGNASGISYEERLDLSVRLTLLTGREVSIIDISTLQGIILQEVLVKGVTLKNRIPHFKAHLLSQMYEFSEDILPTHMLGASVRLKKELIS